MTERRSEDWHQRELMKILEDNYEKHPFLRWLHHIPNGGVRTPHTGAQLKASGVRRGVFDLFSPAPTRHGAGLYIEMKAPAKYPKKNGRGGLTAEQALFGKAVVDFGYEAYVCYSYKGCVWCIENAYEIRLEKLGFERLVAPAWESKVPLHVYRPFLNKQTEIKSEHQQ